MTPSHPAHLRRTATVARHHDMPLVASALDAAAERIEGLERANGRLRSALDDLAREHEHQAEVWRDEADDLDNAGYHAEWARFARETMREAGR